MLPGGSPQLLFHSGPNPSPTRVPASVGMLCAFLCALLAGTETQSLLALRPLNTLSF